jgi:hypothetical protein
MRLKKASGAATASASCALFEASMSIHPSYEPDATQ